MPYKLARQGKPFKLSMYKVIGADKKEYGPVSADVIRRWVGEGRANSQTMVQPEGSPDWKPLSEIAEFADLFAAGPPPSSPQAPWETPAVPADQLLTRDYSLDIGSCVSRSWELLKAHFWPIIGISLLVMVAMGAINQIVGLVTGPEMRVMVMRRRFSPGTVSIFFGASIVTAPAYAVLMGGLFRYYLKLIRGQRAEIGDAFSGFTIAFGQLALVGLVKAILSLVGYLFCILPGIYLSVAWIFAVPLVIDRRMEFWEAMKLSRKVVSRHWFLLFGFVLVLALIDVCGLLVCCIGLLVSIPLSWVALMYAYEDMFGRQAD
jgi:hypothetical protein